MLERILHNNFDNLTKLFSDLYPAKFLDTSELFFLSISLKTITVSFL